MSWCSSLWCRNPFLFRGPIPTSEGHVPMKALGSKKSQSLLIQRSYSYQHPARFLYNLQKVAIPSYSEVLFLPSLGSPNRSWLSRCRNPFLFRGPIPTGEAIRMLARRKSRNPFLFRGPIPTKNRETAYSVSRGVAIPSYSEVLFLLFGES